jgi:hypothetical protein
MKNLILPERLEILKNAVGKTEKEVREIIKDKQNNIDREEFDAVMIKLFNASIESFNEGVQSALLDLNKETDTECPYSKMFSYVDYIHWSTGYNATGLAILIHGEEKVRAEVFC